MSTILRSALITILIAIPASAELIDLGIVTRDTDTGLDWLDLSESTSLSYADIVDGVGNTLAAEGWRHATGAEVCDLLVTHAFAPDPCPGNTSASRAGDVVPELRALLGILFTSAELEGTSGYYDDGDTAIEVGRMQLNYSIALDQTIVVVQDDVAPRTESFDTIGNLLVRPPVETVIFVDAASGSDTNDGLTPGTAVATVSKGLELVGTRGSVEIGPGVYAPSAGELFPATGSGDITVRGSGIGATILDGESVAQVLSLGLGAIRVEQLTVRNGSAGIGAGIIVTDATELVVQNVELRDNAANIGGGLHVQQNARTTPTQVAGCLFEGNTATAGGGLQFQINAGGDVLLDIRDTIFHDNDGTALQFQQNGVGFHELVIDRSIFRLSDDEGINGSANSGAPRIQLTNSILNANGEALVAFSGDAGASVRIVNSTFTDNAVGFRTSIPDAAIHNSIFWDNGTELVANGGTVSFSVVQDRAFGGLADGGENNDGDPLLDVDLHLLAGSPAIDRGSNAAASAVGLQLDIDGDPRFQDDPAVENGPGGAIDIGADEAPGVVVAVPTLGPPALVLLALLLVGAAWRSRGGSPVPLGVPRSR